MAVGVEDVKEWLNVHRINLHELVYFALGVFEGVLTELDALQDFLLRDFLRASLPTVAVSQAEVALKESSLTMEYQSLDVMSLQELLQLGRA